MLTGKLCTWLLSYYVVKKEKITTTNKKIMSPVCRVPVISRPGLSPNYIKHYVYRENNFCWIQMFFTFKNTFVSLSSQMQL